MTPQRTFQFKQILSRASGRLKKRINERVRDMNFDYFPLLDGFFSLEYNNMWHEMYCSQENFGLSLAAESIKKLEIIFGKFSRYVVANSERSKTLLKILANNDEFNYASQSIEESGTSGRPNAFAENSRG